MHLVWHSSALTQLPQVDLYRDCPFWQENGFCMNRECGITTVDEVWVILAELSALLTTPQSEIPERWRAAALSKVEGITKDDVSLFPEW